MAQGEQSKKLEHAHILLVLDRLDQFAIEPNEGRLVLFVPGEVQRCGRLRLLRVSTQHLDSILRAYILRIFLHLCNIRISQFIQRYPLAVYGPWSRVASEVQVPTYCEHRKLQTSCRNLG